VVDRLTEDYAERVELVWNAFELRPEPVPLPPAANPERQRRWATSVLPMAAERGLVMRLPTVATRTRLTFQAAELARDRGVFDSMHRGIFEALFRDDRDIGDKDVLAQIGAAAGLDPAEVARALDARTYLGRVLEQEQLARQIGVTGVPAMFVGDDLATAEPVVGAVPYEWLQAAVERALAGHALEWRRRALRSAIPIRDDG